MSLLPRALCVAFLLSGLSGLASTPAQAADPDDWRFLHVDGSLYDGNSTFRSIFRAIPGAPRFSPDGTRLAGAAYPCNGDEDEGVCGGFVRIIEPDGNVTNLPEIADFSIRSITWAPDASAVAVLGQWNTPGDIDRRIYRVPLDGSPPALVYSDTRYLRLFEYGGISWHPTNGSLAFIASADPEGDNFFDVFDSDQVFTVPASGGTPTRYSASASCETGICESWPSFRWPTWSPDGRLAVTEGTHSPDSFSDTYRIGLLAQGAATSQTVVAGGSTGPMAWSADGAHLAHGTDDVSGDFYSDTRILDMTTGTVVGHVERVYAAFADWQPCPTGACVVWGDVATRLSVDGVARRGKVIVSGSLDPAPTRSASVSVTLHKRTRPGAAWRKVATVSIPVQDGGYRRAFDRPAAVQCRAKATYYVAGPVSPDLTSYPRDTVVFLC